MIRQTLAATALLTLFACAGSQKTSDTDPASVEAPAEKAGPMSFGAAIGDVEPTAVAMVLKNPTAYADQEIVVKGEIRQVCQNMGCWFEISAGPEVDHAIRVTSPGHDVLIPKDSAGKTAIAKGTLGVREVTEEMAEHYRSEGAAAEAGMELTLLMTGVTIQ